LFRRGTFIVRGISYVPDDRRRSVARQDMPYPDKRAAATTKETSSKGVDQNFFGVLIDFDSYLAPID
jgi:hypothetical protein